MGETAATGGGRAIRWVTTTQDDAWVEQEPVGFGPVTGMPNVFLDPEHPQQRIDGIGGCFNELGWDALALLPDDDREAILADFFAPGAGLNLSLCRMPVGANDFSRDWYSYDEVDGDFALEHFSIDHDRETLVPFIRAAQRHQPELRLWASPWSPPVWMKRNGHYACAQPGPFQNAENGLRPEQVALEGTDTFRLEPPYLDAYARYFGAFIDAYAAEGIAIEMVMPQNEFNSPQVFPSCTWTPPGLAAFVAELGPQMARAAASACFSAPRSGLTTSRSSRCWPIRTPGPTSPGSGSSGRARGRSAPSTTPTPSWSSTRPSRSAATGATTGASAATPGR